MAGTVYLKTDRFEVKLEGLKFKVRDFEPLCTMDVLFPKGKVWQQKPVVGLDVMRHPRNPSIGLLLLCFGIGCVILRFHLGEELPDPIVRFLQDERISFVGFGIPEKKDLFPFDKLGLKVSDLDVGYLAAKLRGDPKLKKCELADLARRVVGIKKMVGLTEASSLRRHVQIKSAICEVFVSTVIAMTLLDPKNEDKLVNTTKKSLFAKNVDRPPFNDIEGWSKMLTPAGDKEKNESRTDQQGNCDDLWVQIQEKGIEDNSGNESAGRWSAVSPAKNNNNNKPAVKGILKCSSSGYLLPQICSPPSSPEGPRGSYLKRANSKGHNVSFVVVH